MVHSSWFMVNKPLNNQQSTTNNQQPTINNQQPTINYERLAEQSAQTFQRWSSPPGVGHWHMGQRGKLRDRACIDLAQSPKAAFGLFGGGVTLRGILRLEPR
jgi:hypothetical protein